MDGALVLIGAGVTLLYFCADGYGQNPISVVAGITLIVLVILLRVFWTFRGDAKIRATFIRVFALAFVSAFVLSVCMAFWTPLEYSGTARIEVQKDVPELPGAYAPTFGSDPNGASISLLIFAGYFSSRDCDAEPP